VDDPDDCYEIIKLENGISNLPSLVVDLERRFEHMLQAILIMQGCPMPFSRVVGPERRDETASSAP
jgi:hypothetical protein